MSRRIEIEAYALIVAAAVVAVIVAIALIIKYMVQGAFCHFTGGPACRNFDPQLL